MLNGRIDCCWRINWKRTLNSPLGIVCVVAIPEVQEVLEIQEVLEARKVKEAQIVQEHGS